MFKSKDNSKVTTVIATTPELGPDFPTKVSFTDAKLDASGSFGVVYQARLTETGETVAIKKVAQDRRYRNRELDIMRQLNHTNIVKLKYYYYAQGEKKQMFLCLILEYFPSTLFTLLRQYCRSKRTLPLPYIKVFAYQLFRSLAYLHSIRITHRDVKPPNLLINMETGILKLCDFGSAKHLVKGEPSVSYICSRYYRAPELLFNATEYTAMVDVWSAGCVLVELILGRAIFVSNNCVSQLVEIMKVLGTPSKDEIWHMNKVYAEYSYPHLDPHPWQECQKQREQKLCAFLLCFSNPNLLLFDVFMQSISLLNAQNLQIFNGKASPEAIDLVSRLLVYTPSARITPLQACAHKFFNKLREPGAKLPNGKDLPPLFNFSEHELKIQPNLNSILIPPHLKDNLRSTNDDVGRVVANASSSTTNNVAASEIQSKNL